VFKLNHDIKLFKQSHPRDKATLSVESLEYLYLVLPIVRGVHQLDLLHHVKPGYEKDLVPRLGCVPEEHSGFALGCGVEVGRKLSY
jgi:hypothetical protein